MAKALMGSYTTPETIRLLDEIRALRARVAELEAALSEAEVAREGREQVAREGRDETQREHEDPIVTLDSPVETASTA